MAGIVFSGYLSYKLNIFPNENLKVEEKTPDHISRKYIHIFYELVPKSVDLNS